MVLALKGRKSSSSSSRKSTRHDDTLFGQDTVELLLGISEGPIAGLADGASTFYVGDVPLLDKGTQTPNISNFELRLLRGTNPADSIKLNLGGISSTKNVGLDLRTEGQTIVVNCDKTQIDYLDLRFVVQQLFAVSPEGGEFPFDIQFKVEVKPRSSGTWQIPFNNEPPPPIENGSGGSTFRPSVTTPGMVVNAVYRETYTQPTQPAAGRERGAMWFNTSTQYWTPKIWNGAAWADPAGITLGSQNNLPVWTWLDFDGAQRKAWYSGNGITPNPELIAANDFLLTPAIGEQIYSYNDTAWVGFQNWSTPQPAAPGVLTVSGLARSAYPKEYRIPVARINEPYDIRVTRLSPVSTKTAFRNINFESVQEVNRDPISFPDLAIAWLTIKATDTFTSIPDFTGVYRGLVIPVPSNYTFDETTKSGTYTGLWDGSFKMAYTNNPAWHAYNFIMNSRYGKNSYYPEVADKWDYYEFGKHCDAHKFRFNEYITEPRSLNELINYIVGIAGGRYVDRGDGFSTVIWDADDQPALALFTPENTIEGSFTYSFTDITERKNDFRVSFKNPALNYREDRLRVYDQNHIAVNGRNPEEFVAVGCRDQEEAVRRGRLRLATALTEKTIISFKTNRLGRYLLPFQVFLVSDPQSSNVISGRIKNVDPAPVGTSVLPLRDQIYLEAAVSYTVQFNVSDGAGGTRIVSYPLTVTTPGLQSQLRLSRALSEALPEYAVFSIGSPKAFRITSIAPADDNPDQVDITGIEVNRLKWAFVDGLVDLRDILGLQTGPLSKFVYPPTDARIAPEITTDGKLNLLTTWQPTETKLNRGYRVYESINGEPMRVVYDGDQLVHRTTAPVAGTYVHSIVAVGLDGTTESAPITVQYVVANGTSLRSVSMPMNLRLVDEPDAPIFRAIDPRFTWDAATDPLVTKYRVEVLNGANQVVHAETVSDFLQFTYTLAANRADNGGTPLRQFTVQVRSIDMLGNLSQPASLVVSHPAPIAPSFELSAVSEVVFVETTQPTGDWAGTLVFMEKVSGYNPVTTKPRADQRLTFFPLPAEAEQTYYVRVAAYDSYGKTGLNYSNEKVIKATIKLFDTSAPAIPGNLTLVSNNVELSVDGTISSKVIIQWPAVTSSNLGRYEVAVAEGNNPVDGQYAAGNFVTGTSFVRAGLMPGRVYSFKVRSVSNSFGGVPSGWSTVLVVTAAANTTPPAAPTVFTVNASFEAANLAWTNPANKDLLGVEIWASTTNVLANATLLKTVPSPAAFYRDVLGTIATKFYWIRSVNTSDFKSGFVGPQSATSGALVGAQLAPGIIDATRLASSIAANTVVASLPTTKTTAYVTLGDEQYRWDAAAGRYTKAVSASDISGKVLAAQIDTVNAGQIAGQVQAAQIAAIEAGKITGALNSDQIASLAAAKVAGTLTAANIDFARLLGTIAGTQIAAGSIVGSKLAIVSTNMAYNADASQGALGYALSTNTTGATVQGPNRWDNQQVPYAPSGFQPVYIRSFATGAVSGIVQFISKRVTAAGIIENYPVLAGTNYEFSACLSTHRCGGVIIIVWLKADGSYLSEAGGSYVPSNFVSGGSYADFPKSRLIATAPSGAASAVLYFRMSDITAADPYLFVSAVMFAATRAGATETSPYVAPGVTTIDGSGIITRSLAASKLVAESITAGELAANSVVTAKIAAGAVVTSHMTAGTINANVLVAQSITAGLIAASTITGDKIAGRTIAAGNIIAGTITGNEILAGSVNADRLVANSITTAQIAAGAVKADQIDAGAITAGKLGVGLNTGNLCWNSDQALPGWYYFAGPAGINSPEPGTYGALNGTKSLNIRLPGTPAANGLGVADLNVPNLDGTRTTLMPIQGGKLYEFSAYLSVHRCTGWVELYFYNPAGTLVASTASNIILHNVWESGAPLDAVRAKIKLAAPATAVAATLRVVLRTTGESTPNVFASGFYLAIVPDGIPAGVFSDYVPQSRTVINGGQVATGSLSATAISAGTITTDRMQAGQINLDTIGSANSITTRLLRADVLQANNITVGNGTLSSLIAGTNTTRINGGAIETNTILANRLRIGARGIQIVGLSFYAERSNGVLTGVFGWTFGSIIYTADDGSSTGVDIPANRAAINGGNWYVVWGKGESSIGVTQDWASFLNRQDVVLLATVSGFTAISSLIGGTIIDGTRITTQSIQADQIAANQIQTQHMAANSIRGDRILAGSLSADRITTGVLTVGSIIQIGPGAQTEIWSDGNGGGLRVRNSDLSRWRSAFGYIGNWTGDATDYGMILWRGDGAVVARFSNAINYIAGVVIGDAEITNAKIANLTVGNEKVQNEAITRGAFNTSASGQRDIITSLTVRNPNTRLVIWGFRTGEPGSRYLNNVITGNLQIFVARPGMDWQLIREIPNAHCYEYDKGPQANYVRHMPTTDCCQWVTLEAGWHQFMVRDTSSASAPVVTVTVVEFSK